MAASTPTQGSDTADKMSTSTLRERPVYWEGGVLHLVNQPALPEKFEIVTASTVEEIAAAITKMTVRGAPAIGAAGAYGMFCGARESSATTACVFCCWRHRSASTQHTFHTFTQSGTCCGFGGYQGDFGQRTAHGSEP